jgi:hypothetical protein
MDLIRREFLRLAGSGAVALVKDLSIPGPLSHSEI